MFVVCRCGVDMQFHWPRGQEAVRCFGCGARFPRPSHLPVITIPPWVPPQPTTALGRLRGSLTRAQLIVLALCLVAAGLLGIGIGFLLSAQ